MTSSENEEDNFTSLTRNPKKVNFIRKVLPTTTMKNVTQHEIKIQHERRSAIKNEVQRAAMQGLQAMVDLYEKRELDIFNSGTVLDADSPGAKLAMFSAPSNFSEPNVKAAYAALETAKILKKT